MTTLDDITKLLGMFNVPVIKLVMIKPNDELTMHEEIGIQVYCPRELKGRWMEFVETIFAGQGLDITYLQHCEMIDIRLPEKVFNPINN